MYIEYPWRESEDCSTEYDLKGILAYLNKKENKRILDLGCGKGTIALELVHMGYDVYGVDGSQSGIEIANEKCNSKNARFFVVNFSDGDDLRAILPDDISSLVFDTVISTQVIEHLYSPETYARQCCSILPHGGMLIITTPYHGYLKNLVLAATGKMDNHFHALWEGGHIKFWSRKTLSKLLEENGFEVVSFKGLERVPYLWKSMLLVAKKK